MLHITATDLPRIMACNGSLFMEKVSFEDLNDDTTARDEGNAAHWLVKHCFENGFKASQFVDQKATNGVFITKDIAYHVDWYLDDIRRDFQMQFIEKEMSIYGSNFQVNCRTDHIAYMNHILYIDDFKFGHRIVEPEENWTLIAYAIAFCNEFELQPNEIVFAIYQPRANHRDGPLRKWSIGYNDLAYHYCTQLNATLSNPDNVLRTGPHCKKCPSRTKCQAARNVAFSAIDEATKFFNEDISNEELSFELSLLLAAQDRLDNRLSALQDLTKHRLRQGQIVENFTLETGKGNTTWKKHVTPEMVKALTGQDYTVSKLVTPTKAKREGMNEDLVNVLSYRPDTGTKLVQIDANKQAQKLLNTEGKKK